MIYKNYMIYKTHKTHPIPPLRFNYQKFSLILPTNTQMRESGVTPEQGRCRDTVHLSQIVSSIIATEHPAWEGATNNSKPEYLTAVS
jgi:hypothetical protein